MMKSNKRYDFQRDYRGHGSSNTFGSLCSSKDEVWKPMMSKNPDYNFDLPYWISNKGSVYSSVCGCILKAGQDKAGSYGFVYLKNQGKEKKYYIHRLVAFFFCDNPKGKPDVNHLDGNKLNNHSDNLEWVTQKENAEHYHRLKNELKEI